LVSSLTDSLLSPGSDPEQLLLLRLEVLGSDHAFVAKLREAFELDV
jgi:hypothetical protein